MLELSPPKLTVALVSVFLIGCVSSPGAVTDVDWVSSATANSQGAPGAPDPIPENMVMPEVIMLRGDSLRINLAADQPSLWFTMLPVADKAGSRPTSSRWTPLGSDSIEVAWVPTRSPMKLLLAVRGNTLQGTATALSDAGPARGTGDDLRDQNYLSEELGLALSSRGSTDRQSPAVSCSNGRT